VSIVPSGSPGLAADNVKKYNASVRWNIVLDHMKARCPLGS
jgi:hypothetical protein